MFNFKKKIGLGGSPLKKTINKNICVDKFFVLFIIFIKDNFIFKSLMLKKESCKIM